MSGSKVRVTFISAHGLYNGGESAGFDPVTAMELNHKGITRPFCDKAEKAARAARAAEATDEAQAQDHAARLAELEAREAAVAAREAAVGGASADDSAPEAKAGAGEKVAAGEGAPPKQGAKA